MTTRNAMATLTLEPTYLKTWTVTEYHRLSEMGLLAETDRTELLAGQITLMAAKGTLHVTSLRLLLYELNTLLRDYPVVVITQDPIQLDDQSEPEPDLVVARGTVLDYADRHPQPSDLYLVVEVADSTLKKDCDIKDKLYAQAGIADYWVVDVINRQLHVFRNPTPQGYTSHLILSEPNQMVPLAFPDALLTLTAILPPRLEL